MTSLKDWRVLIRKGRKSFVNTSSALVFSFGVLYGNDCNERHADEPVGIQRMGEWCLFLFLRALRAATEESLHH